MKKEKYRLTALLKIREQEKKRLEMILASELSLLQKARKKMEELKEEKKRLLEERSGARKKMDAEMNNGQRIGRGCFHVNFLRKLKEDIEAKEEEILSQKEKIEEALKKVAKARKDYIEAIKRLRVMEKHKGLWEKKRRREITIAEEREMDNLGQTIHRLRQWRGEKSPFQI